MEQHRAFGWTGVATASVLGAGALLLCNRASTGHSNRYRTQDSASVYKAGSAFVDREWHV